MGYLHATDVAGRALYPSCCTWISVSRTLKYTRSTQLQRKRGQPHLCSFGLNVPRRTQFRHTRRHPSDGLRPGGGPRGL